MNGPHDLGGMDGFGPVDTSDPPRETWHLRVHALAFAAIAATGYGTPRLRHAIERIPPADYLAVDYYEKWGRAIVTLLAERGLVTDADIAATFSRSSPARAPGVEAGANVTDPAFSVGDAVRVRNRHPLGHTRCPRYVRGHAGTVVRYDGPSNFDDVEAHSDGKRLEPLYCVRFTGAELWGDDAEAGVSVSIDLFEPYLEVA